jgi:hypothetical protein
VPVAFHGNYRQGPGIEVVVKGNQIQLWLHGITQAVFINVRAGVSEGATTYRLQKTTVIAKSGGGSCTGTMTLAQDKLTFALDEDVKACALFNRGPLEAVKP